MLHQSKSKNTAIPKDKKTMIKSSTSTSRAPLCWQAAFAPGCVNPSMSSAPSNMSMILGLNWIFFQLRKKKTLAPIGGSQVQHHRRAAKVQNSHQDCYSSDNDQSFTWHLAQFQQWSFNSTPELVDPIEVVASDSGWTKIIVMLLFFTDKALLATSID